LLFFLIFKQASFDPWCSGKIRFDRKEKRFLPGIQEDHNLVWLTRSYIIRQEWQDIQDFQKFKQVSFSFLSNVSYLIFKMNGTWYLGSHRCI
jgi:hypothetical protein